MAAHTSTLTTKFQQALEEERRLRKEAEDQAAALREAEARRIKAIHDKQQQDIDAITAQQAQNTAGLAAILQTLLAMPQVQAQANVVQPPLTHIAAHLAPGHQAQQHPPKPKPVQTPPLTKTWKRIHLANNKPRRRRETKGGTSALADDVPVPTMATTFKALVEDAFSLDVFSILLVPSHNLRYQYSPVFVFHATFTTHTRAFTNNTNFTRRT